MLDIKHITVHLVCEQTWLTTVSSRCSLLRAYRKSSSCYWEITAGDGTDKPAVRHFASNACPRYRAPCKFCSYTRISGNPLKGFTFTQWNSFANRKLKSEVVPVRGMRIYRGAEVWLHSFLTSALDGKQGVIPTPRPLNSGKTPMVGNE
jgi:hypothetical protein